jgi:hypothetical protein
MRFTVTLVLAFLTVLMITSDTLAQRPDGGSVEFAMLGGLNVLTYEGYYGGDDSETYLTIPSGSSAFPLTSMLRMSVWTRSIVVYDLGFSVFNVSDGGDFRVFNTEGGIGAAFGESDARTFPFAGVILGVLSLSNGDADSEIYLGFQGGFRHLFRKHAAVRMQIAYRSFLGDALNIESSLEIAGGLSFLI